MREVPRRFREARGDQSDLTDLTDQERWALHAPRLEHDDPAVRANGTICLIHQANFLLDRQTAALERAIVEGGGYSEQLATARLAERQKRRDAGEAAAPCSPGHIPSCPQCGKPMVLRTAKEGPKEGR